MLQKDLRKKLSSEPQLVYHYRNAMKAVYGVYVKVKANTHDRFISKEKELLTVGISTKDYAYGVAVLLESWAKGKYMKIIPVNVFLGKWAWGKYMKVHNSVTVTVDNVDSDDDVGLLWSELLVARTYIQSNLIDHKRFCDVVDELRPLLNEAWLELYTDNKRLHIETLALMQLEEEYLVNSPRSYTDIVTALVLNGHS